MFIPLGVPKKKESQRFFNPIKNRFIICYTGALYVTLSLKAEGEHAMFCQLARWGQEA